MDTNLKTIIDQINKKNGKTMFDSQKISNIERILSCLPKLEYLGHGIQSICFKTGKNNVVKCCVKRKNSIISSKNLFLKTTHDLLSINMPILPLIDVLYEDDVWMVYTQPMCRMITDISLKFCYHVLKFVKQMIDNNIRISDIYYKNFGIYQNKILLFDYHDIEHFDSSSNFLITNIYSLFTLLGHKLGWNVQNATISHWNDIVADNFGTNRFPVQFVELLIALHNRDKEKILFHLNETFEFINIRLKQKYPTYDTLKIEEDIIVIDYPIKQYHLIFDLIQKMNLNNVLDTQSNITGVGLKLAQDFPNILVTLECHTVDECNDTRNIISNCLIYNACVTHGIVKPTNGDRYDLVLYHTIIFDLLQTKKPSDLFQLVRNQVGKYFILDVPIKGDIVLAKIIKNHKKNNYEYLLTPYTFRTYLCANKIKVNRCIHIDYGSRQIKRFMFICSIE